MGAFDYKQSSAAGIKPTGLINGASSMVGHSGSTGTFASGSISSSIKTVDSGATTAGTLKTILSLSGKGCISFFGLANRSVATTHRVKITLDGVVIFDATSTATTANEARCYAVIGAILDVGSTLTFEPLLFESSLLIEYAAGTAGTNCSQIGYRYIPR